MEVEGALVLNLGLEVLECGDKLICVCIAVVYIIYYIEIINSFSYLSKFFWLGYACNVIGKLNVPYDMYTSVYNTVVLVHTCTSVVHTYILHVQCK